MHIVSSRCLEGLAVGLLFANVVRQVGVVHVLVVVLQVVAALCRLRLPCGCSPVQIVPQSSTVLLLGVHVVFATAASARLFAHLSQCYFMKVS